MRFSWPVFLWLSFCCGSVHAAGTCYQWRINIGAGDTGWLDSSEAGCSAAESICAGSPNGSGCGFGSTSTYNFSGWSHTTTPGTWPAATCVVKTSRQQKTGCVDAMGNPTDCAWVDNIQWSGGTVSESTRTNPNGCPECEPVGNTRSMLSTIPFDAGDQGCVDGCLYEATSPSSWILATGASYIVSTTSKGVACATSAASNSAGEGDAGECASATDGTFACASDQKNCGEFNGDLVCPQSIPAGACVSFASGGVACTVSGTPTSPPVPDNGTAGEPAEPSGTAQVGNTTSYYYNSSIVSNSTTIVETEGSGSNTGGIDDGSSGGGGTTIVCEDGSVDCGTVEDNDECLPGEECAGDLPEQGSAGECDDFAACFSTFFGRVQNAPIVDSVSGVSAAFPTGSCPVWDLEAFGETYALSAPMCEIWDDVSPILSAAFLFIWGWVATRIFLSA